jgi:hypothetical protein
LVLRFLWLLCFSASRVSIAHDSLLLVLYMTA